MKNCLDTGTIQGFLDGELTPPAAADVSAHIATCDACAAQLAAADEESAFVFSVLEREMDTLVPTQRLWSKINDSIEVEKQTAPFWKKAWAYITISLASPSMVGAAAVLIVFAVIAGVMVNRNVQIDAPAPTPSRSTPAVTDVASSKNAVVNTPENIDSTAARPDPEPKTTDSTLISYKPSSRSEYNDIRRPAENVQRPVYIPGEASYVKTIATLSQSVDTQKDSVLRPSERVSFERDLAVVNDAIDKMKKEVRRNPKNESAKQVLYTSYQNKIDLLNSVSQREELVASLKD